MAGNSQVAPNPVISTQSLVPQPGGVNHLVLLKYREMKWSGDSSRSVPRPLRICSPIWTNRAASPSFSTQVWPSVSSWQPSLPYGRQRHSHLVIWQKSSCHWPSGKPLPNGLFSWPGSQGPYSLRISSAILGFWSTSATSNLLRLIHGLCPADAPNSPCWGLHCLNLTVQVQGSAITATLRCYDRRFLNPPFRTESSYRSPPRDGPFLPGPDDCPQINSQQPWLHLTKWRSPELYSVRRVPGPTHSTWSRRMMVPGIPAEIFVTLMTLPRLINAPCSTSKIFQVNLKACEYRWPELMSTKPRSSHHSGSTSSCGLRSAWKMQHRLYNVRWTPSAKDSTLFSYTWMTSSWQDTQLTNTRAT